MTNQTDKIENETCYGNQRSLTLRKWYPGSGSMSVPGNLKPENPDASPIYKIVTRANNSKLV